MLSLTLKSLFRLARPCCLVMMPKTAAIPLFLLFISAALIGGAWGKVPSSAQSPVIRKDSKISAAAISNAFVQQNQNSMVHPSTHHGMSLRTLIINIVADLSPHGMLPLAFGMAQGGPSGIIPSIVAAAIFGAMSASTMIKYATLAAEHKVDSIGELWSRLINPKTRWVAELSIFSLCAGCCIFYSAFIGDIFGALVTSLGVKGFLAKRWVVLAAMSSIVLLPLCMLEDLSALQFSSFLGVVGILYTVAFHIRRLLDKSYTPGADFLETMAQKLQPSWPSPKFTTWRTNKGTLVLVNLLCVAFLAHYNAIAYFKELDQATPRRYSTAIAAGFGTAFSIFVVMMLVGYSIFGSAAQPLILNNFHRSADALATLARLATGLAITFAYPLMFAGVKSSMYNLLPTPAGPPTPSHKSSKQLMSTAVLVGITSVAFKCGEEDVSFVLGIVGSVLGCGVAYILPGLLGEYSNKLKKKERKEVSKVDSAYNYALMALGSLFGVLGVWITLTVPSHH